MDSPAPRQKRHTPARGQFQCATCQHTYTRADHLTRHVRSHLQDRPFKCHICNKGFRRSDLLKRHAACHQDESGNKRQKSHRNSLPRVHQACLPCAGAKLKCDDEKPCSRCLQRGIDCLGEVPGAVKVANNISCQSVDSAVPSPITPVLDHDVTVAGTESEMDATTTRDNQQAVRLLTPFTSPEYQSPQLDPHHPSFSGFPDYDMSLFLNDVISSPLPSHQRPVNLEDWPQHGPNSGDRGLLDFTIDSNFDFEDLDFIGLDSSSSNVYDIDRHQPSGSNQTRGDNSSEDGGMREHAALGIDAYQKSSFGLWEPSQHDRTVSELEDLTALGGPDDVPRIPHSYGYPWFGGPLNQSTRDSTLAMILETCKPESKYNVVRAFPTRELFDDLLRGFFSHHRRQPDSFIHYPTFRPNSQEPELLSILAAIGGILTDRRPLQKLGLAMQEVARTKILERFEKANNTTRELWALQTFICEIETGLWSGIKRKMEIAESHPQTLYTMLRRARRFQAHEERFSPPLAQDTEEVLHQKWLRWVDRESRRRLVFHAFILDTQCSIAMGTSPIMSFAELATSFPEKHELWLANAEQWKSLYLDRSTPSIPISLVGYLRAPTEIPECYDVHFCHLVILCGIWGIIWQHSQLRAALNPVGHWQATGAMQQQGLIQMLQDFRIYAIEGQQSLRPETALLLELLHVHLHSSFENIELFAGKGGLEDARRVFPSLQHWSDTSEARQAVWHSGQVIRAARDFRRRQLQGFYAIALYQASLVLWAYGTISLTKGLRGGSLVEIQAPTQEGVHLDGPDSPAVRRFITLGKGLPSISQPHGEGMGDATPVPLSEQGAVMNIVLETLSANFACRIDCAAAPPLVENLAQLLRELGRAASSLQVRGQQGEPR